MHREEALALLRQMLGPKAEFRDGQWEAIDQAANRRQRVLVVQRTGWGKSVVYFLAAKILRDTGAGPTLLISPLLSLMRNQILAAGRLGIRAVTIHSQNLEEWPDVQAALAANGVDVLMVSPERLGNAEFLQKLLPLVQGSIGLFVVDEAHCISDWGHDFRPDYRRIVRILRLLPARVPVLCTTATANDRVVQDIESQIPNLHISRGPLVRPSLKLFNIKLHDQAERLAWLAHFLPKLPGNGIIYTLTVQDARRVAEWLKHRGLVARPYHADLEAAERIDAEQQLLDNRVKALVATVALGMGFDKPDLGFVIHFQRPGSVVAYLEFLAHALDDPAAAPCGKCMNCTGQTQRRGAPAELVQVAVNFLRQDSLVLDPRFRWPKPVLGELEQVLPGALERFESGRPKLVIPESFRAQQGRALCLYGDAGWGREVARGKYETGRFSDTLVNAAADLIEHKWKPQPPPQWVTAIPSERHAELVQDFARRLAEKLGLPFVPALRKRHAKEPQKKMQNSSMQLRNVLKAFQVVEAPVLAPGLPAETNEGLAGVMNRLARKATALLGPAPALPRVPVLLVDDMVDSGWTLTMAAVLLLHQGSGPVYPFALAKASPRGS